MGKPAAYYTELFARLGGLLEGFGTVPETRAVAEAALALMTNQIRLNHIHSAFIRPIYANRSIHVVADQKISCVGRHFQMTRSASG